jgi:hypothetical protein
LRRAANRWHSQPRQRAPVDEGSLGRAEQPMIPPKIDPAMGKFPGFSRFNGKFCDLARETNV